jgi:DNA replication protein DnaC
MAELELDATLRELGLMRMAEILKEKLRLATDQKWGTKRFLREMLDEELAYRRERALALRIQRAALPEAWSLDTFPFERQPGVDKKQIYDLAELDFIKQGTNLVFIGPAGVGKTGLASGLLLKALLNGSTGMMWKTQAMLDDLHRSIADRKTKYLLTRLSRLDVLLADEMGYLSLNIDQTNLFFKLMDLRYERKLPTLITTNLGYDDWGTFLKNPPMVGALLSRLRQRCVTLVIDGPDLRAQRPPLPPHPTKN